MNNEGQSFQEIINNEHEMLMRAERDHAQFFTHTLNVITLLHNLVASVDKPTRYLFLVFFSQIKKHITLGLLSAVRRHHVQCGMNLRQVLEATAWASYAMVHENLDLFRTQNGNSIEIPDRLSEARNRWLNTTYPEQSEKIKNLKNVINQSVAHANIAYAFQTFTVPEDINSGFVLPFFDIEDDFRIKIDLLMISDFAIGIIDLFLNINEREGVFQPLDNVRSSWSAFVQEHHTLREQIRNHERFVEIV